MQLQGRLALVTGASSGIGEQTAKLLARRGARLALVARSRERLEQVAAAIRAAGGEAEHWAVDLGQPQAVAALAAELQTRMGVPDLIVNNAGAGRWLAVEETPLDEVQSMLAAPYLAAFYVTRALLDAFISRGSGCIVNVNSPAALTAFPGAAGYSASRAALRAFDDCLAAETRGTGVRVMHLVAGKVRSPYFDHNPGSEERIPGISALIPLLEVEQVAAALVRGVERDRRRVTLPWVLRGFELLNEVAPALVRALVRMTSWRRPG